MRNVRRDITSLSSRMGVIRKDAFQSGMPFLHQPCHGNSRSPVDHKR
ncbi:hypothetical protein B4146_3930 [Bacillus subtilis]|nr:hypothetical protein B4146_3930 [Bacillus subtilis]